MLLGHSADLKKMIVHFQKKKMKKKRSPIRVSSSLNPDQTRLFSQKPADQDTYCFPGSA